MDAQEIRDAISASPELMQMIPDTAAIAAQLSATVTKVRPMEIGYGTILEYFGLAAGNTFLDYINTAPDFRYIKSLLERGVLQVASTPVRDGIAALVTGGVLTQQQADTLIALIYVPETVTDHEVNVAIFNDDGTLKV